MPIIPLITRSNPVANAAAAVLDRERRPTVNTAGQQQAVGNLAKAGQMPELPMSLAAEPGMQAIGDALMQGGSVLSAAAIQQQKSQTIVQTARAADALQNAQIEFEGKKPGLDPARWGEEFDRHSAPVLKSLLEDESLTPAARESIQREAESWKTVSATRVEAEARMTLNKQARDAILGRMSNAIATQNEEDFEAAIKTGKEGGYLFDHVIDNRRIAFREEGERQRRQAKADQQAARFETNFGQITEDPDAWLETNKKPWSGKDSVMWQKLKNAADARKREVTGEALGTLAEAIANGDIRSEADIDAWESKGLTAVHREEAKRAWVSQNDFQARREREEKGPVNAVALRQKAADYDPAQDPDGLEYFKLKQEVVRNVPEGMREGVIDSADAKFFGRAVPQPKEIDGMVDSILGRTFHPIHGAFQWRRMEWQEQWERDPETGQEVKKWRNNTVDDLAVMQRAFEEEARVRMRLKEWMKENPDDARSPEKVSKKLSELAEQGDAAEAMDAAIRANAPKDAPPVTGFRSKGTGYFPVDPGHKDYKMEGGRVGAAEWHGKPIKQEPLYTLDDFREGKAPYVSVAMDNSKKNPLEYGTILRSPQFPGVPFRVMDTGSAFNGKTTKYGPAKGLSKIDIARRDNRGANAPENNRHIDFEIWDDFNENRIASR